MVYTDCDNPQVVTAINKDCSIGILVVGSLAACCSVRYELFGLEFQ